MPARRATLLSIAFGCIASLAACSSPTALRCPAGMNPLHSELLYFGASSPRGPVTQEQWADFLDASVTPRFPDGFSAWQAEGQWRNARGEVAKEASWVLNVVHAGEARHEQAFAELIDIYKAQFQQEAVLRVQSEVCANLP